MTSSQKLDKVDIELTGRFRVGRIPRRVVRSAVPFLGKLAAAPRRCDVAAVKSFQPCIKSGGVRFTEFTGAAAAVVLCTARRRVASRSRAGHWRSASAWCADRPRSDRFAKGTFCDKKTCGEPPSVVIEPTGTRRRDPRRGPAAARRPSARGGGTDGAAAGHDPHSRARSSARGDFFITPTGDTSTYANGPEILDRGGNVVWFHAIPQGLTAADFRTQNYRGQPVLTFWQGTGFGGLSSGTDYIYNDHYQQIATVNAGNGLSADGHEFLITPWNTALILSYTTATANLTSIGGPADQTVINGVVQEIDISDRQGAVPVEQRGPRPLQPERAAAAGLAEHAVGLVPHQRRPPRHRRQPADRRPRHLDHLQGQPRSPATSSGSSAARTPASSSQAGPGQTLDDAGEIFAWQHDPEALGDDRYTFFDNESAGTPEFAVSRAVTVKLDPRDRVATLIASDDQPEGLVRRSQGNAQTTGDGGLFVGWGALPYFSEFDPSGQLLFNAQFPTGVNTYRAYLLPWDHQPTGGQRPVS